MKKLKESQENKRCWVPYGRMISEILHQGGILKALSNVNFVGTKGVSQATY